MQAPQLGLSASPALEALEGLPASEGAHGRSTTLKRPVKARQSGSLGHHLGLRRQIRSILGRVVFVGSLKMGWDLGSGA